ncbi:MAG: hypothetical protein V1735_01890 [Nanoarchaeota archaeon]
MPFPIFQTQRSGRFLDTFNQERGDAFLQLLKEHFPGADYPYLALFKDEHEPSTVIRPDSRSLGGLRGKLRGWSPDYNASTAEGLARMIHDEAGRPTSEHPHLNPITCVVDFCPDNPLFAEAYKILEMQYGMNVEFIALPR